MILWGFGDESAITVERRKRLGVGASSWWNLGTGECKDARTVSAFISKLPGQSTKMQFILEDGIAANPSRHKERPKQPITATPYTDDPNATEDGQIQKSDGQRTEWASHFPTL
jgi:hypothetical protein